MVAYNTLFKLKGNAWGGPKFYIGRVEAATMTEALQLAKTTLERDGYELIGAVRAKEGNHNGHGSIVRRVNIVEPIPIPEPVATASLGDYVVI